METDKKKEKSPFLFVSKEEKVAQPYNKTSKHHLVNGVLLWLKVESCKGETAAAAPGSLSAPVTAPPHIETGGFNQLNGLHS